LNFNKKAKKIVWSFLIIGLFVQSKVQFVVIMFWVAYFIYRNKSKLISIPSISLLILLLYPFLLEIKQVGALSNFISVFYEYGLAGLNEQNSIWTSFTFRLSSVLSSLSLSYENIFGIGFGAFHSLYIDIMRTSQLGSLLSGQEITGIIYEDRYATPKSSILELVVSCGLFFLTPMFIIIKKYFADSLPVLINVSIISLLIAGFLAEIAPFLTYLVFLLILQIKISKNEN